jgi:xylulokinase
MRQAAETGQDAYDLILSQAAKRDGHLLLLPHFAGSGTPHGDPLSKGAILGLTLGTTRADIVRAIVEAVCFDLRQNLESLQSLGFDIQEMRATGGGARSPFWLQLKADITGVPVISLRHQESGCLGAAILAGLEIGRFRSVEEAVAALIHLGVTYEPDPARHRQYEERYGLYREIYSRLADIHHRL